MIRFIDVYKEYDNGTKALKGIDLRIDDGEFVFLVGPSGSGDVYKRQALMGVKPQNAAPESWEDPARHRGEAVTSAWRG